MYDLDYLIKTFTEHAEEHLISQNSFRLQFCEENPGKPVPKHMLDDFNLPEALASICIEIRRLNDRDCTSFTLPDYPMCSCSTHGKCQLHQAS